jgi:hypothetical protein
MNTTIPSLFLFSILAVSSDCVDMPNNPKVSDFTSRSITSIITTREGQELIGIRTLSQQRPQELTTNDPKDSNSTSRSKTSIITTREGLEHIRIRTLSQPHPQQPNHQEQLIK